VKEAKMGSQRHPNVVHLEDVEPRDEARGDFRSRRRRLGAAAGGRALGCTHFEIPPGKTAFPFHFHSAFEEAIYVLEGAGRLRIWGAEVELRAGDYVGIPAGPDTAHALTNTGPAPLRYLCVSGPATPMTMDIVAYPDSKKVALASGIDPVKGLAGGGWVVKIVKEDGPAVGYFDGEPLAEK
jgi:uncharacterized cupin superfamily protein